MIKEITLTGNIFDLNINQNKFRCPLTTFKKKESRLKKILYTIDITKNKKISYVKLYRLVNLQGGKMYLNRDLIELEEQGLVKLEGAE